MHKDGAVKLYKKNISTSRCLKLLLTLTNCEKECSI